MRHRRKGRVLGRSPSHRKALFKNLTSALFLTERDATYDDNAPKNPGRIITTTHKAKEVRPLVEKCITIAKKSLPHAEAAKQFGTTAARGSDEYKAWRKSDNWQKWAAERAPVVVAQRRVLQLIGDRQAVAILFETIAPRYVDRPGGYTRIMRLATPRLGDAGERSILQLVGEDERRNRQAERPSFASDDSPETESESEAEAVAAGEDQA